MSPDRNRDVTIQTASNICPITPSQAKIGLSSFLPATIAALYKAGAMAREPPPVTLNGPDRQALERATGYAKNSQIFLATELG